MKSLRPPVRRYQVVCSAELPMFAKKTTAITGRTSSCLATSAIQASSPPSGSEPESPMKTFAGKALYQRKPRPAPALEGHALVVS